jgi:hypothetical protein
MIRRTVRDRTGIYAHVSTSSDDPQDWEAIFAAKSGELDQVERLAALERFARRSLGTAPEGSPQEQDASDLLASLRFIRYWIDAGDAISAAMEGIRAGSIAERMQVRSFEPLVERGRRAASAAQRAGRARSENLAPKRRKIRERFAIVHPAEVKSRTAAVHRVARELGIKPRTVWRALEAC